jgi:hypothetical protein
MSRFRFTHGITVKVALTVCIYRLPQVFQLLIHQQKIGMTQINANRPSNTLDCSGTAFVWGPAWQMQLRPKRQMQTLDASTARPEFCRRQDWEPLLRNGCVAAFPAERYCYLGTDGALSSATGPLICRVAPSWLLASASQASPCYKMDKTGV